MKFRPEMFQRIIVIGCPGSGKSTFSRKLREITGLPLYYLDMIWHKEDGNTVSKEEFDKKLTSILQQDRWIIDGNYQRTLGMRLERCDTVFLLDYPLEVCLSGAEARIGTKREDLPWQEEALDPEFRQWILDFPRDRLPGLYQWVEEYRDKRNVVIFKKRQEADAFMEELMEERLRRQLTFALEIDKEKNILRQTHLSGHGRRENDAEHAWHMAIMAYLLREYSNEAVDIARVMLMCLIHDIVEIEAGDTYAYDAENLKTQKAREEAAKEKLYSLLPADQKQELIALFDEFEAYETAEARFAHAMDNLQPLLLNHSNNGGDWVEHGVSAAQVYGRQSKTRLGSEKLFQVADGIIQEHIKKGHLKRDILEIPYGATHFTMDKTGVVQVLESRIGELKGQENQEDLVRKAMAHPLGTPPLWELSRGKKRATVIISDHTRPVPSKKIIPFMLEELRRENPHIEITLLVATGCHRGTRKEELLEKLGKKIVEEERILVHDCDDEEQLVELGILPSGARLVVNRAAVETDLLVAEGFIEPHFFAGFSGGRKSVLPGICSRVTVLGNHCGAFIDSPYARSGCLEKNPIHRDMEAAAAMAGLSYIVNVVIDENKEVAAAFAGDVRQAHKAGCAFLGPYCQVRVEKRTPIVVTSNGGAPLDQNVYQTVKGICTADAAVQDGGVIIICAECADGTGGEDFYRTLRDCESIEKLLEEIRSTPMEETVPDQWQYQILARILEKKRVIYVTEPKWESMIREMKMDFAPTLEEALRQARKLTGDGEITVIPNGISVYAE